ncbi:hypothetical protein M011DRAFT_393495 [Sporormia fimetaria CBS 119925]|uniref:Uncharacterized protein n=1 Tax=Sporormia fimetaria CBS 119925 TaxID=1340428 RepID=A0A6A6VPZ2_9PLEO|nr:hypothetical protein M011DRAFT_393495 [Sporormia fimetaria CBS 119925]
MSGNAMQLQPGRGVGAFTLGSSLHEVLTTIDADADTFPTFEFYHDDARPLDSPVHVKLPDNGIRLQFDGPDQRLRLIEVLDFTKAKLLYKDSEVFRMADGANRLFAGLAGPSFRHIYDKVLGLTYDGEYVPPRPNGASATGTYNLSYPGVAVNFPVQHSAYSPQKDVISLLSSSATGPATSMAVFSGESWQEARGTLFTAPPPFPRSSLLVGKSREGCPDEIELARIHGEGKVELVRRNSPPFWLLLGETTPQDLIMELGPPDSIFRKSDNRLSIHRKDRRESDVSEGSGIGSTPDDTVFSEQGSAFGADDDDWDDTDGEGQAQGREIAAVEHFYNYYHHGFDILISQPSQLSSAFSGPGSDAVPAHHHGPLSAIPLNHLAATKIILHGNVPGSYQFNRHRRSRWALEHAHAGFNQSPLTSEMHMDEMRPRLKKAFQAFYENDEQAKQLQRGMALNRGWDDSPSSSTEFLGDWEDGSVIRDKPADSAASTGAEENPGNTTLFGFPGLVFEVLKNGAVSHLTVY